MECIVHRSATCLQCMSYIRQYVINYHSAIYCLKFYVLCLIINFHTLALQGSKIEAVFCLRAGSKRDGSGRYTCAIPAPPWSDGNPTATSFLKNLILVSCLEDRKTRPRPSTTTSLILQNFVIWLSENFRNSANMQSAIFNLEFTGLHLRCAIPANTLWKGGEEEGT